MEKKSRKIKMPDPDSYEWWLEGYRTGQFEALDKSIKMLTEKDVFHGDVPTDLREGVSKLKNFLANLRKTAVKHQIKSKNRINYFELMLKNQK